MEITSYTPGTPSWIDLGSPDIEASVAFYGELFGWESEDMGPDAGGYRIFNLNGKSVAGLGPAQRDDVPPYWTTYISVEDADATAEAIVAAGGQTFMEPMDVMDAGRMAVFADNVGAPVSIWQANKHVGCELVNEPGTLTWNELMTRDIAGSKAFYSTVFGWELADMPMDETIYCVASLPAKPGDDKMIGGLFEMGADFPPQMPSTWVVYFNVEDTDATVATALALGAQVIMEPKDIAFGRIAGIKDPQGAIFSLLGTKS